ncbi:MAG TPA: DUF5665 domain-containing protein [Candidatus Saccharimonadales bacterium]|nr:DUF5665 domain-containing protein [Candidatus Saccharimonadales bacterium]
MAFKEQLSDKQRIEFAKQLEYFYEISHPSWRRVLTFSFLKGLATGFGVFLGGTIIIALLLWVLSLLGHVPFLNDIADSARESLQ